MAKGLLRGALAALLVAPFVVVMGPVVASQALPGAAVECDVTYILQEAPPTQGGAVSIFKMDSTANTLTTDTSFTPIYSGSKFDGLAADPVRNVFWAVADLIGKPVAVQQISPVDNSVRAFGGDMLRYPTTTPTTRSNVRVGALDLTSNIYYYGYIEDNTLHLYGFRVDTETPIPGEIATIDLTVTPAANRLFGDIAFDSNGNLYISVDGLIAKTGRLPVVGSSTPPRITVTRLVNYPTSSDAQALVGISFAPNGILNISGTAGTASFDYTYNESTGVVSVPDALTPTGARITDAASCLSATVPGSFPVPPVTPLPASPVINSGWDVSPTDPGDAGSSIFGAYGIGTGSSDPNGITITHPDLFGYFPDGNRAVLKTSGAVGIADAGLLARDISSIPPAEFGEVWTLDGWLTPAARLLHSGTRCLGTGLCDGPADGTFTIEFDQPVENLSLHIGGLSGDAGYFQQGSTTVYRVGSTLTEVLTTDRETRISSSNSKSLEVTAGPNGTYVVGVPDGIAGLGCARLSNSFGAQNTPTQYTGCGTLLIPGIVKSITFSANLEFTAAVGGGIGSEGGARNEFGFALSYDRLAVDAPVPTPTPTPTPEPLSVPAVVPPVPVPPAAALAATGSSPVWWAAAAAGLWLVAGTVLMRRRRAVSGR